MSLSSVTTLHFTLKIRLFINYSELMDRTISRKDKFCPFFFDVQSYKNPFFEVFKVPKSKGVTFDKFDEIIGRFQFCVGIR